MSADVGDELLAGEGATGIPLHCIIDRNDLFPQPLIDRSIPLLQRAQPGSDDFASGGISSGLHEGFYVPRLFGGKAKGELLRRRHPASSVPCITARINI